DMRSVMVVETGNYRIVRFPLTADGVGARAAALEALRTEIGDCQRCPLHRGRTELVFGFGNPAARLMFIADGPREAEDQIGVPFLGRSGETLGRMVRAMGLRRTEVYLCYLVKCFSPDEHAEAGLDACHGFLEQQVAIVRPEVIIAFGDLAARRLTGQNATLPHLRGKWFRFGSAEVLPTFHPDAFEQNRDSKRLVWGDLRLVMKRLGLKSQRER
ncbi:MAG: uracil-DNA glycosylase, partial [Myxococcales bacterium]|nr:uracil-DNA glycosylase [Myxococcales bacterium]